MVHAQKSGQGRGIGQYSESKLVSKRSGESNHFVRPVTETRIGADERNDKKNEPSHKPDRKDYTPNQGRGGASKHNVGVCVLRNSKQEQRQKGSGYPHPLGN